MYILGIDTTAEKMNIALSQDEDIISCKSGQFRERHMVNIMGCIDSAVREGGISIEDVGMFAANTGPGDFTGTRIGLSVAKILAWALGRPAYGIYGPDILAVQTFFLNREDILARGRAAIFSCMDVRRGQFFCSYYLIGAKGYGDAAIDTVYKKDGLNIYKMEQVLLEYGKASKKIAGLLDKDSILYICGDLAQLSRDFEGKKIHYEERAASPYIPYLNRGAYFKRHRPSKNLVPFYARDFVPFGGSDEK